MFFHMSVSVEIDQMSDAQLRDFYCIQGSPLESPAALRQICRVLREQGFEQFPPCNKVDERGACKGHDVEEARQFEEFKDLIP